MGGRFPLADRLFKVILAVITIPLLFGGLVAAGEADDARVLLCGAVALVLFGTVSLTGNRIKVD